MSNIQECKTLENVFSFGLLSFSRSVLEKFRKKYIFFRLSHSTPSSPRLLPRRARDAAPTPPPSAPMGAYDVLDAARRDLQASSDNSASGSINWQEKCLELQLELQRSRAQATRTRDMLREKVSL